MFGSTGWLKYWELASFDEFIGSNAPFFFVLYIWIVNISNMPKITQQRKHATKPTVIKVTKVCTICTDKKPTAIHRCTTCKTSPTCFKCVKDWIMNDGGIIDSTGKFVYSCPTCRGHLNISATMLQDSDVKTKLYKCFLHEVENYNVDNARNMLGHYPWLATEQTSNNSPMCVAANNMHIPMLQLLSEHGATMFDKLEIGCMPIHLYHSHDDSDDEETED